MRYHSGATLVTLLVMLRSVRLVVGWIPGHPVLRSQQRTNGIQLQRQQPSCRVPPVTTTRTASMTASQRWMSNSPLEVDEEGRTIRKRSRRAPNPSEWDGFDPMNAPQQQSQERGDRGGGERRRDGGGGAWDDFDAEGSFYDAPPQRSDRGGGGGGDRRRSNPGQRSGGRKYDRYSSSSSSSIYDNNNRSRNSSNSNSNRNNYQKDNGSGPKRHQRGGPNSKSNGYKNKEKDPDIRKTNMKALEGAGFVHLYGLASVLNALHANKRDFTKPEEIIDMDLLDTESYEHEMMQRERKPEAQFSPWLFVQEKTGAKGGRSYDKAMAAEDVAKLAKERGIPTAFVDKGVLNTLCGSRPHQGYVLRCGKLSLEALPRLPHPRDDPTAPKLWLVLDEVVDPQNLGALLRSAYFIGGDSIGVLVCAKNSAPPTPVVSAASAGALELIDVQSTSNLPRTLNAAKDDGFRIIGASSSPVPNSDASVHDLHDLPQDGRPTLLVLGSEGHGLRTLVAKACTDLVRIPGQEHSADQDNDSSDDGEGDGGNGSSVGVDSLNVSVTGGILLWHLKNSVL